MRPLARMFGIPIFWYATKQLATPADVSVVRLDESVATGRPIR